MSCGTPYRSAARVTKARGMDGKVCAHCAPDLPLCLYEGLQVHVVPPLLDFPRTLTVVEVEDQDEYNCVVAFEEFDSIEDAEKLAGHFLLVHKDDLEEMDGLGLHDLLGRNVEDERYGSLGTVSEVIETAANDVLVVQGPLGEVLIPLIEQAVLDIPEDSHAPIVTRIMDGLVEQ